MRVGDVAPIFPCESSVRVPSRPRSRQNSNPRQKASTKRPHTHTQPPTTTNPPQKAEARGPEARRPQRPQCSPLVRPPQHPPEPLLRGACFARDASAAPRAKYALRVRLSTGGGQGADALRVCRRHHANIYLFFNRETNCEVSTAPRARTLSVSCAARRPQTRQKATGGGGGFKKAVDVCGDPSADARCAGLRPGRLLRPAHLAG